MPDPLPPDYSRRGVVQRIEIRVRVSPTEERVFYRMVKVYPQPGQSMEDVHRAIKRMMEYWEAEYPNSETRLLGMMLGRGRGVSPILGEIE